MDTCVETALQLGLGIPLVPKIFTAKEIQQSNLKTLNRTGLKKYLEAVKGKTLERSRHKMETRLYATACDKLVKTGLFLQSPDSSPTISET